MIHAITWLNTAHTMLSKKVNHKNRILQLHMHELSREDESTGKGSRLIDASGPKGWRNRIVMSNEDEISHQCGDIIRLIVIIVQCYEYTRDQ